jgi:hypothetical protein
MWCAQLVMEGIRFWKMEQMHKIVVDLIINVWFWGESVFDPIILEHHSINTSSSNLLTAAASGRILNRIASQ